MFFPIILKNPCVRNPFIRSFQNSTKRSSEKNSNILDPTSAVIIDTIFKIDVNPETSSNVIENFKKRTKESNDILLKILQEQIASGNHKRASETLDLFSVQNSPVVDGTTISRAIASTLAWYRSQHPEKRVATLPSEGLNLINKLYSYHCKFGTDISPKLLNTLLYSLALSNPLDTTKTKKLLDEFPFHTGTVAHNNLMLAYSRNGSFSDAQRAFRDLADKERLTPNVYTYSIIINTHVNSGDFNTAMSYYYKMRQSGINPNSILCNRLIFGSIKEGDIQTAMYIYQDLISLNMIPTPPTIEILIRGLCQAKSIDLALDVFHQLSSFSILTPTQPMYLELILALLRCNRVSEAIQLWHQHFLFNQRLPFKTLTDTILKGLIRRGYMNEALSILNTISKAQSEYATSGSLERILSNRGILNRVEPAKYHE